MSKLSMLVAAMLAVTAGAARAEPLRLSGSTCVRPPVLHCPDAGCPGDVVTNGGPVTEPLTGRAYFLDYPCDLERGDQVVLVLSLHGGGSYGNWQRHYFPIVDYVDRYRLIVATPFSPRRVWGAEDDAYLQNIAASVIEQVGRAHIKAFWLAGHSQGGLTSTRLICNDFFKTKVDGFLSLSGGRVGGQAGRASGSGIPPACDFSHIFATGEHEISALPKMSERAQRYGCDATARRREIVDVRAGYVHDGTRQNPGTKAWGLLPRPGKAEVLTFRGCRDRRLVADVVRIDKGHTEGLEPKITEELVKMMLSARGGKIQQGG